MLSEQFGLEPEEITEETSFEDLGADSVDIVEFFMNLQEEFGLDEMGEEDMAGIHTVGDLLNELRGKLGE